MRQGYYNHFAGHTADKPWLLKQRQLKTLITLVTIIIATVATLLAVLAWIQFSQPTIVSASLVDSDDSSELPLLPDYKPLILTPSANSSGAEKSQRTQASVSVQSAQATSVDQSVINSTAPSSKTRTTHTVEVNGKNITVPKNGEVHKEVQSKNGTTKVDISATSNSTSSNNSSLELNVHSSNESSRQAEH